MIHLKNICKQYTQGNEIISVLENITVSFEKGKKIALLGPSGSGKTTLLSLLAGFEKPSSGEIFWDEVEITSLSSEKLQKMRREEMGFVFQNFELLPSLTVLENVMLPLALQNTLSHAEQQKKAENFLEKVGIAERKNFYPAEISGGQAQRVAVARALVSEPRFVFADEPTGNLDDENSHRITKLLKESILPHQILVVITHDHQVAQEMDMAFALKNGHLLPHIL